MPDPAVWLWPATLRRPALLMRIPDGPTANPAVGDLARWSGCWWVYVGTKWALVHDFGTATHA